MLNQEEYDRIARSDCFVCRIVAGKPLIANVQIVYEDDQVIAFLNQFPTQEGYTIVCPKTPRRALRERFERRGMAAPANRCSARTRWNGKPG